jgi:hypothetical protein
MPDATEINNPTWKKLPPLTEELHSGCLICGSKPIELPLTKILAVGFGNVEVTKGSATIWSGDDVRVTLESIELKALEDPDHDYRVRFITPLWEGVWQRQEVGQWLLVWKGPGFA